jgi:hypothetical protein
MDSPSLQLRDIHLPDGVSWWPPAIGWWLLVVVIMVLLASFYLIRKWWRQGALLRSVNHEFLLVQSQYKNSGDHHQAVRDTSVLLRRIALAYHPRQQTAALTGDAWLALLDSHLSEQRFQSELGQSLINAPYQSQSYVDIHSLFDLVSQLIATLPKRGVVS